MKNKVLFILGITVSGLLLQCHPAQALESEQTYHKTATGPRGGTHQSSVTVNPNEQTASYSGTTTLSDGRMSTGHGTVTENEDGSVTASGTMNGSEGHTRTGARTLARP